MSIYTEFIETIESEALRTVCNALHDEILLYPNTLIKKKFNLPFFYGNTWVCYLNFVKKKGSADKEVELCFVRGRELPSKELLNFKERVMIGGLSFSTIDAIDWGILKLLLEEAIHLDQERPYTFTKKKK